MAEANVGTEDQDLAFYQMLIDSGAEGEAINLIAGMHGWCGTGWTREDIRRRDKVRAEYEHHGIRAAVDLGNRLVEGWYAEDPEAEAWVAQERGVSRAEHDIFEPR